MKIVNFNKNKNFSNAVDGDLALKLINYFNEEKIISDDVKNYEKPMVKKLVLMPPQKKNTRIFMGCYQYSYQANDGDGC